MITEIKFTQPGESPNRNVDTSLQFKDGKLIAIFQINEYGDTNYVEIEGIVFDNIISYAIQYKKMINETNSKAAL